jgi:ATP-binding protein involved in chromosome partitioning
MDPSVRIGGDAGKPVIVAAPESVPARALRDLAEQVAARLSVAAMQSGQGVSIDMVG